MEHRVLARHSPLYIWPYIFFVKHLSNTSNFFAILFDNPFVLLSSLTEYSPVVRYLSTSSSSSPFHRVFLSHNGKKLYPDQNSCKQTNKLVRADQFYMKIGP